MAVLAAYSRVGLVDKVVCQFSLKLVLRAEQAGRLFDLTRNRQTMNRSLSNYNDSTAKRGYQHAAVVGALALWRCPIITIINVKRTMSGSGFYFDGLGLSTS